MMSSVLGPPWPPRPSCGRLLFFTFQRGGILSASPGS